MKNYPVCKELTWTMNQVKLGNNATLPGPEGIKHFSCSTQLSTKVQLLIKT